MILVPHDPAWSAEFEALVRVYRAALGRLIVRIEHVGSTAVPDLAAKPILDIDIVMRGYGDFPAIVDALARLGYRHNGDQGIPQREAFKREGVGVPYADPARAWMDHHLYVCPAPAEELRRHLAFREALRGSKALRQQYEAIKRDIAVRSDGDRQRYAAIKEEECRSLIEDALAARERQ